MFCQHFQMYFSKNNTLKIVYDNNTMRGDTWATDTDPFLHKPLTVLIALELKSFEESKWQFVR